MRAALTLPVASCVSARFANARMPATSATPVAIVRIVLIGYALLRFDARRLDDLAPLRTLGADLRRESLWCIADQGRTRFREPLLHRRIAQRRHDLLMQPLDDRRRRAGRRGDAEPG